MVTDLWEPVYAIFLIRFWATLEQDPTINRLMNNYID